jgi:hypothetical protein
MMNPLSCLGQQLSSIQDDLDIHMISEVFDELESGEKQKYAVTSKDDTWEFSLSSSNRIETIFLYTNRGYGNYEGITPDMSREDIIELCGTPDSTGKPLFHPILGQLGGWEKYKREDYYLHIEHVEEYNGVNKVTLMVLDPSE